MTSLRQIESNRRNAQRSTGPKTQSGKARSSQNAVRHGLTAETVIGPLEDPADYQAFEQAVLTKTTRLARLLLQEVDAPRPENSDGHANGFPPRGDFQPQQYREDQRVDGPHADDDGRMADRSVVQANRETHLIHSDAKEAQVKEDPEIAQRKPFAAGLSRFGKCGQAGTD
jgi:recombinational DNA repair protein RecT